MIKKVRVVLDTNIYLSAIIFGGKPREILNLARKKQFQLFTSPSILLEVTRKLEEKFNWQEEQVKIVIKALVGFANIVQPSQKLDVVKKDQTDNKILECAEKAKAEYVITGDRHLLNIKKWKSTEILKPSEFIEKVLNIQ